MQIALNTKNSKFSIFSLSFVVIFSSFLFVSTSAKAESQLDSSPLASPEAYIEYLENYTEQEASKVNEGSTSELVNNSKVVLNTKSDLVK